MGPRRLGVPLKLVTTSVLATVGVVAVSTLAWGTHGGRSRRAQNQLIPLYDNANPVEWTAACSQTSGSGGGSWIIADAAHAGEGGGPGRTPAPAWAGVIENCYGYGRASVIGYVWTNYGEGGQAALAAVERQIDGWYAYYPGEIAGIFFDGVSDLVPGTATSNESFYRTLASYVHTRERNNDEVVFNFGTNPASDWMLNGSDAENADIVVTFEGSYDTPGQNPYTSWTQADWELRYPANDFAALIHDAPDRATAPQPTSTCRSLAKQNIGYVYVGTSYEQLPPYFRALSEGARDGNC